MRSGPPRVARALVSWLAGSGERVYVLSDLAEEYDSLTLGRGQRVADGWYWRQVVDSAVPLLTRRLTGVWPGLVRRWSNLGVDLRHDVRHGARVTAKSPLVSGALVLTLALAVGATTAIYSVLEALVLTPLPFSAPERLMRVVDRGGASEVSWGTLREWRTRSTQVESAGGYATTSVTLDAGGDPERVQAAIVTDGFAAVLGLEPVEGRAFVAAEHGWRGPRALLISHELWQRRFGGDASIIGRDVLIDEQPARIVGVMPALGFAYPSGGGDVWLPLAAEPESWQLSRRTEWLAAIVRLRPDALPARAAAELTALRSGDGARRGSRYRLQALHEAITGPVRPMLSVLGVALTGVLLLACANLAMLLAARGEQRRAEFAVRAVLGGRGGRIVRQVLTESALLACAGGVLGLWIAREAVRVMIALYPGELPRGDAIGLSAGELAVAAATTLLLLVAFGVPAAVRAARAPACELRIGWSRMIGRHMRRTRAAMVVFQVAMSVALLIGGGLLVSTFWQLHRVDPGFQRDGVLTFHVAPSESRYDSRRDVARFHGELEAALRSVPGVQAVGSVNDLPFGGVARTERVRAAFDRRTTRVAERDGERRRFRTDVRAVRGAYFTALGVPLVRGSWFDNRATDERVTVLNETLANRLFGDSDPIGRRVVIDDRGWEVIGVVGDTRSRSLGQRTRGEAYVPGARESHRSAAILLRTAAPPHTVVPAVRAAVHRIDPALALADIATMAQRIETSIAPQRFHAALLGGLSVLALLLAATAIYGLVAYSVSQRNREIGIRLALGEDARTVRRRVLLPVLGLALTGCIAGALLAIATSEWFDDVMEEVAADPGVIAGVPLLLLAVAFAAAWGPARRASRVDPMIAIRE